MYFSGHYYAKSEIRGYDNSVTTLLQNYTYTYIKSAINILY